MTPATSRYAPPPPRWDIVAEHLDEAEFLWDMRARSLLAPHHDLADVAAGPERRLLAHLDGLVIAGPDVAARLLLPALEASDPARVSAAACALLRLPEAAAIDVVFAAWQADPRRRQAIAGALAFAGHPDIDPRLRAALAGPTLTSAAAALLARGEPLGPALVDLLAADDPAARALGLRAVPDEPDPGAHVDAVIDALAEPDPVVRDAAILAGARLGLPIAWTHARERAQDHGGAASLLLLALAADPASDALLRAALARPKRRAAALWALGFVGTPEAVDQACEWLDDPKLGPLAGEVVTAVAGVDLARARLAVRAPAGDLREVTPEHALPHPEPMAVLTWWTRERARLTPGRRHLAGAPRTPAALHAALARGPMRRRPAHLLDLQLHGCPARLLPAAPTRRQRVQLAALADQLARTPPDLERLP